MKRLRKSPMSILNSWNDLRQSRLYAKATKCSKMKLNFWGIQSISKVWKQDVRHVNVIHWKRRPPRSYCDVRIFIYTFLHITKPIQDLLQTMNNNRSTSLPHRFFDTTNRIQLDGWRPIVLSSHDWIETEWHCPIYNKEVMAVAMGFEFWTLTPLPRRSHQYHRLYWPSQLESFHVSHPIERQTRWPTRY